MSAIGLLAEGKTRKMHGRRVSEETVYSVHSSSNGFSNGQRGAIGATGNFLPRRNLRTDAIQFKNGNSYVAQRVLSAKVLRFKEIQNELQEVKNQLHEVMNENKLLRNLQKRQDTALSRYEDSSAALPRLLENHRAEVNTLKAHAREVRAAARSLHRKLQRSEAELLNLREQHEKLLKIADDKDLEGRAQLQKRIEELEDRLNEMKEKNIALNRKMEIEQKSHSQQMNTEITKRKALSKELQGAMNEIARLSYIIDEKQCKKTDAEDLQNNSVTNIITSGNSKLPAKKLVMQRNTSKKYVPNSKVPAKTKPKTDEIIEKDNEESNQDFHIPLQNKSSEESLLANPTLAQNIINGLQLTRDEYLNENPEENDKTSENEQPITTAPTPQVSSNGDTHSWYDESKVEFSTTPSRTSCEVNVSKSSAQSERRRPTSYIPPDVRNDSSDSSDEEKIQIKIKKERIRPANRRSAEVSHDTEPELQRSSRYKSMKNNLNKIQDHMNKFDNNVDEYIEEKAIRNKDSPYGDIMEKGVKKHGNFDNYIKKLEEIDRLNDNIMTAEEEQNEKTSSSDEFYSKSNLFQTEAQEMPKENDRKPRRRNVSEMDLKTVESDKFLDEIDTSYKLIRTRMDAENEVMNQKLQQYCKDVSVDVQAANDAIDRQKQSLERNRRETEMIERAVRTNTQITEQLKFGSRIDSSKKTQLLAALKAIDCGKEVDDFKKSIPSTTAASTSETLETASTNLSSGRRMNKKQIMKELFES